MGWEGRGESRVEDRGQEEVDVENLCSVFVYRLYSQWERFCKLSHHGNCTQPRSRNLRPQGVSVSVCVHEHTKAIGKG